MSIFNATDGLYFPTVTAAINASSAGDVLLLPAGQYVEEFPLITHSLTLQGVGGMARLMTPNPAPANDRAVLMVPFNAGADLTVRNIEITGAARPIYQNGAGILFETGNGHLQVEDSWFHDNENGILVGGSAGMTVSILRSEFGHNGLAPGVWTEQYGLPHNLYVNGVDSLSVVDSYFHSVQTAHELKSRAKQTTIINTRFVDGADSQASYSIDLPNGGVVVLQGNQISKGPQAPNRYVVHYGGEVVPTWPDSSLEMVGNIVVNQRAAGGTGVFNQSRDGPSGVANPAVITGNAFYSVETIEQTAFGPSLLTLTDNTVLIGPGPAISTAHPFLVGPVGLHATAEYTITPLFSPPEVAGTLHDYNITLHNDGTTTIGTFWFAWNDVPDENYMTVQPQLLTPPTGWNAIVTHNGPSDGFGIEWVASTPAARLAPGNSLAGFSFRSTMDVLLFAGISPIGAGVPTTSSVLYEGLPLSGLGFDLNPTAPDGIPCFRQGTRLRTPFGWCAVEDLAIGDAITLRDSTTAPVKWLGWRSIDCRRHPRPRSVWPVRVARHAFGPGRPARDLFLSPDHAVFAAGRLVPAHLLVNGATITQEPTDSVTYWHVELPSHAIVSAEGLAAESYLDTGNRAAFANAPDAVMMHPDFSRGIWERKGCAPLLLAGPALSRLRTRLLARAERLGHALTDDPDLRVLVDGAPARLFVATQRVIVTLRPGARVLQLRSRTWTPAETTTATRDPRRLGVAIANPRFDLAPATPNDPRLTTGWHPPEGELRWTDGDATIQVNGARRFDFDLAMVGRYWKNADRRMRMT